MVNWDLVGAILLPNVGGWLGTLTMIGNVKNKDGNAWYQVIKKPKWTPPNWVFGPAWTALYTTMGIASYIVVRKNGGFNESSVLPLSLYGSQLLLNWTWTPVFFGCHRIRLGFFHMLTLDVAAVACTASFFLVDKVAGYIMLPYLAWLGYATALNYAIWKLNDESV